MTHVATPLRVGLFGLLGGGNIGNDGSLEAVVAHLRAERPDAELEAFCCGPEQVTARFGIAALPMQQWASYRLNRSGPAAVALKALGKVVDAGRTVAWVRRQDAVIVPGAGVLEATLPMRPWGFPYALFLLCLSGRLVGVPVALVDVGAEVIDSRSTRWLVRAAARLAAHRSYRDRRSRDVMRGMGVGTSRDEVGADLVFSLPTAAAPSAAPSGVVGVGVMDWSGGNADRHRARDIHDSYIATMTAFVGHLVDDGRRVRLFIGDAVDDAVVAGVVTAVRTGRPGLDGSQLQVDPIRDLHDLERQMNGVDTVVATRYHNIVTALRLAKPTLALTYAPKSDAVMTEMGLGAYCHPARFPDLDRLVAQFAALEAEHEVLRRTVAARVVTVSERLRSQLSGLCGELLGERPPASPVVGSAA